MFRRFVTAGVSALLAGVVAFGDGIIRDVRWQIALHHHGVTTSQVVRYSLMYAEIAAVCAGPSVLLLAITSCVAPSLLSRWYVALGIGIALGLAATVGVEYCLLYPTFPAMAANDLPRRIWPLTLASALMFVAASVHLRGARSPVSSRVKHLTRRCSEPLAAPRSHFRRLPHSTCHDLRSRQQSLIWYLV